MTDQVTSLLVITPLSGDNGMALPPYSARGLVQTLQLSGPSGGGDAFGQQIRESVNGVLINMFPQQFRKYSSVISCTDVQTPCIDAAYLGQTVEVECCTELSYPSGGTPQRDEVSGSSREADGFVFYRPLLVMMVTAIKDSFAEFNAAHSWQVNLREVRNPAA